MSEIDFQQNSIATFQNFLVNKGYASKESIEKIALAHNGKDALTLTLLTQAILNDKVMDEEDLTRAKAEFFNLPYVDLRKLQIPSQILVMIPKESRDFYGLLPFALDKTDLKVAISDPTNLQALQALEFLGQKANVSIQLHLASAASIETAMGKKKNLRSVVGEALKNIEIKEAVEAKPKEVFEDSKESVIEDAPIIKIVDVILSNAIEGNASDIHIEPSETDVRVRYRIDGILHTSLMLPRNVHAAIVSRIKILSNLKIDEQRIPQDGRFHVEMATKSIDMRVSTLPLIYGEKIVMRILDKSGTVPTLEQLGLRGLNLQWIMESIKKTHGISLITGPTGSGKSTTLYSILSILNTISVNIVTLEDPVEYFIEGVNQSQVNPEVGLTFASGLRSILRQDPNIIMVGEVRDKETAELAVHAALTGHLVFSTLHTNNSIGAMPRMIDMGIEPFLLIASVNMVLAQRLIRKICVDCKAEIELTSAVRGELEASLKQVPPVYWEGLDPKNMKIYKGAGCEKCEHTGYRGRFGIFEVLPVTPEVQDLVASKASATKLYEAGLKLGMITMKQDGFLKVLRGETTIDEIIRVTTE